MGLSEAILAFPWPLFKINRNIAFCLALQARIAHGSEPALRLAIIFEPAILNGLMEALANVMENDPGFLVARHGKTNTISTTLSRHAATSARIANIAELPQLNF